MTENVERPITAITLGDPAGIGPEIVVDTMMDSSLNEECRPFVIGNRKALERAADIKGVDVEVHPIDRPEDALFRPGIVDLLDSGVAPDADIEFGTVQKVAAEQAYSYLTTSIDLGLEGRIDAVSTAPINKAALRAADVPFIGHTEIYEKLTDSPYALTMFNVHKLRVFFLSRHVSLRQACDLVTTENVLSYVRNIDREFRALGFVDPSIAVAALNPHGGESRMFGREEIDEIVLAVEAAQAEGINARGPLPADSIFAFDLDGHHDCILSLYHDQGHIACKTLDFEKAVTVILGLPFMRSSVDHGTAFDIAGRGIADGKSTIEATRVCRVRSQEALGAERKLSTRRPGTSVRLRYDDRRERPDASIRGISTEVGMARRKIVGRAS